MSYSKKYRSKIDQHSSSLGFVGSVNIIYIFYINLFLKTILLTQAKFIIVNNPCMKNLNIKEKRKRKKLTTCAGGGLVKSGGMGGSGTCEMVVVVEAVGGGGGGLDGRFLRLMFMVEEEDDEEDVT